MNLCIDIGNTALKFALFESDKLFYKGKSLEELEALPLSVVKAVILSTVVENHPVLEWVKAVRVPFLLLDRTLKLPVHFKSVQADTLGTDRIAAAAGAVKQFPHQNTLVITAGTCITYNLVSPEAEFLGGIIAPGLKMRFKAMHQFTSRLPAIEVDFQTKLNWFGQDTQSAMQAGVYQATLNEIEGFIKKFEVDFENLNIVMTGGDAAFLVSHLKNNIFVSSSLILEGLNYILQLNANKLL